MTDTGIWSVRAEAAMTARRWDDALVHLRRLIEEVARIDFEYEEWLRSTADCFDQVGRKLEAQACHAYLNSLAVPSPEALADLVARARTGDALVLRGIRLTATYLSRSGHHEAAALWFSGAAMPVHQAIELERAGQDARAAALWKRIIDAHESDDSRYELSLARINHGLCLHRLRDEGARAALSAAISAVEEVADRYETGGLRERAFDCYQLLARIGSETGRFENVAEGYLNCIRILRDDTLKLDALRLYEAFVCRAREAKEHHAVASTLREASDYCVRAGLPYAEDLRLRSGEAWIQAAQAAHAAGLSGQLVENAHVSAAEAFVSVRAHRRAAGVYRRLVELELGSVERYQRLLERLGSGPEDAPRPVPVPEFLKRPPDYEEVWYVDLAEWELDGDPALIAAGVMADRRFPDFVRRHGLLLVLELLRNGERTSVSDIVRRLQSIRAYPVIDALENLYHRGDASVRREVCSVLGNLRFKRSFTTLTHALGADDPLVRREAATAISNLFFPHAFDRLRRIYESRDLIDVEDVKVAVIKAIGRINTVEALEFLCDRLRESEEPFVGHATAALFELTNPELSSYLRQQIDYVPSQYHSILDEVATRLQTRARR